MAMNNVIDFTQEAIKRGVKKVAKEGIESGSDNVVNAARKTISNKTKAISDDVVDYAVRDMNLKSSMSSDEINRLRYEKNQARKINKANAAENKIRRTENYNNNVKNNALKSEQNKQVIQQKREAKMAKEYENVFNDSNITFKRSDVINADRTFNSKAADDYYHKLTNDAIDLKSGTSALKNTPISNVRKILNDMDIKDRAKSVTDMRSKAASSAAATGAKNASDAASEAAATKKDDARKLLTKSNIQKGVGLGVGGYLVLNMFDQGGKMSNAELYGQQQQYGGY